MRACLRAFVVLVALQVAGLPVCIANFGADGDQGCPATCSDEVEDQGLPCPPFCSTCTCVHAHPVGIDRGASCAVKAPRGSIEKTLPSLAMTSLPRPDPDRVFRPPRVVCV